MTPKTVTNFHSQLKGMFSGNSSATSTNSLASDFQGMSTDTRALLEEQKKSNKDLRKILLKNQKILKSNGGGLTFTDLVLSKYLVKFLGAAGLGIAGGLAGIAGLPKKGIGFVTAGVTKIMSKGASVVLGFFKSTISSGFATITKFTKGVVTTSKGLLNSVMKKSVSMLKGMGSLLKLVPKVLGKLFWPITALMGLYEGFKGWGNAEQLLGKSGVGFLDKLSSALGAAVNGILLGIPNWIVKKFGGENLAQVLAKGANAAYNFMANISQFVKNTIFSIGGKIKDSIVETWNSMPTISELVSYLPNLGGMMYDGLVSVGGYLKETVTHMFTNATQSIKDWWNKPWFGGSDDAKAVNPGRPLPNLNSPRATARKSAELAAYKTPINPRGIKLTREELELDQVVASNSMSIETKRNLQIVSENTGTKIVEVIGEGQENFLDKLTEKYDLDKKATASMTVINLTQPKSTDEAMSALSNGGGFSGGGGGGGGGGGFSGGGGGGGGGGGWGDEDGGGGTGPVFDGGKEKPLSPLQKLMSEKGSGTPKIGPTVKASVAAGHPQTVPLERVKTTTEGGKSARQWNSDTYKYLKNEKGFTHQQAKLAAAGFTGNAMVESADFSTMRETNQPKDKGGYGVIQWTNIRREQFRKYAAARGMDINNPEHLKDYDLNFDFFKHELDGPQKQVLKYLKRDGLNTDDTAHLVRKWYERPGVHHDDRRKLSAKAAASYPLEQTREQVATAEPKAGEVSKIPEWAQTPAGMEFDTGTGRVGPLKDQMGTRGNGSWEGVDPRLKAIYEAVQADFPLRSRMVSGKKGRGSGDHSRGKAFDMTLYDLAGQALPNYQNGTAFRAYELWAQTAEMKGREMYPELFDGKGDEFNAGMFFGDNGRGKYKYGSNDLMDFRIAKDARFRGGSIMGGLNEGHGFYDTGDVLGGSKPYDPKTYAEDMAKLRTLKLTPEQAAQAKFFGVGRASGSLSPLKAPSGKGKGSMFGMASLMSEIGDSTMGFPGMVDSNRDANPKKGLRSNKYYDGGKYSMRSGPTSITDPVGHATNLRTSYKQADYNRSGLADSHIGYNPIQPVASSAYEPPVVAQRAPGTDTQVNPKPPPPPIYNVQNDPVKNSESPRQTSINDIPVIDETSMLAINGSGLAI